MISRLIVGRLPLIGVEGKVVGAAEEIGMTKPRGVEKAVQAGLTQGCRRCQGVVAGNENCQLATTWTFGGGIYFLTCHVVSSRPFLLSYIFIIS